MPLPSPHKKEIEDDFISRCMSDEIINQDYPDQKQRLAICYSLWRKDKEEGKTMKQDIERRIYHAEAIEVRKGEGDNNRTLTGYAAVFNSLSEDLGGFREKIDPGAFTKSLKKADVRALWNHDVNYVLGRTKNKTLKLKEDERGLQIEIDPPNTQFAKDLLELIERGDVDQMSFGFRTVKDEWANEKDANIRTLKEVELFDVSPVTWPAYPDTQIALRSLEQWQDTINATIEREVARAEETQRRLLLQKKRGRELRLKRNFIILQKF